MRTPRSVAFSTVLLAALLPAQGTKIGFPETFALATDRQKAIDQLIPGSEEAYFYQCLHWQNSGQLEQVPALLDVWVQRHGRGKRVIEIENRQALLGFERNPTATYAWLKDRLGLRFDAQRSTGEARKDLPTRLDPALISAERFTARALAGSPRTLELVEDSALDGIAATDLDDDRLVALLGRVARPDVPSLVALVARGLALKRSGGFGSLRAHMVLCREQLEELLALRPSVLGEDRFVARYLQTLLPSADVDWRNDPSAREAYLDRLQAFAQRLPAAHNALKSQVLYHRLVHDQALGKLDKERLLAYLRLPRRTSYANPEYLKRAERTEFVEAGKVHETGFPAVKNDEPLVRAALQHFLGSMDSFAPFAEYVDETWLRRLFAETKILLGTGDMERWYSLLGDAAYYEQLKARTEIEFAPEQRKFYGAEDPVGIALDVKNVEKLLVKVYVIDSFAYARDQGKAVDATIDLEGLVASEERTEAYSDNPLRRVRRTFEFATLQRPGTYVVEFVGNGIASRAVIEKGQLRFVERTSSAGQVLTLLDERGQRARGTAVWCGGRLYEADERAEVTIPFASKSVETKIVLRRGLQGTLHGFRHRSEDYSLQARILTARESLKADSRAKLVVRPALAVAGVPIDIRLLEQPVLTIRATDQDGIETSTSVRDLALTPDSDLVHEILVPERLVRLAVTLEGKVQSSSLGKPIELSARCSSLDLNAGEATARTFFPLLGKSQDGYFLEVRGKSGEAKPGLALNLRFVRRGFQPVPIDVEVATGATGRVQLGSLDDVTVVACPTLEAEWRLVSAARTYPHRITGTAGSVLRIPYLGRATRADRASVALYEGDYARDAFAGVAIQGGFVELAGLSPGDYRLRLKESDAEIEIKITQGIPEAGWAVGRDRLLEVVRREPVQVTAIAREGEDVVIRIANSSPSTRVHAFATRFLTPFDPLDGQRTPLSPELEESSMPPPDSLFSSGRQIGDEARYILDRRYSKVLPGNMLQRPGLLLNPWEIREKESESSEAIGLGGGPAGRRGGRAGGSKGGRMEPQAKASPVDHARIANLDFLPEAAPLLANLHPDAQGVLRIPRTQLGAGQLVHVVAFTDRDAHYATLALPEQPLVPSSRALANGLDTAQHFTEQRRIEYVQAGARTAVESASTAQVEVYTSLAKAYQLLATLSGNSELGNFAFLVRWPELTPEEKRAEYSKHACHELHFFLQRKDRTFFDQIIRPYLANKVEKTFFDHYLLDADLARYREPWAFEQLNVVEQILLTQRLGGNRESGARRVTELLELQASDPEQEAKLFATALRGRALEAGPGGRPLLHSKTGAPAEMPAPKPSAAPEAKEKLARKDKNADEKAGAELLGAEETKDAANLDALSEELEKRKAVRPLYRAPDTTRVLAESQYWHVTSASPGLVRVNAFWRDFAVAPANQPFCSPHLASATGSLAEMLLALAVIDLPFPAAMPKTTREGDRVTFEATAPFLLVRQEIRPALGEAKDAGVLISQNLYRLDERFRYEGEVKLDNFVTGEFLVDVAYGAQVVVTNPTSAPRKLDLLLQIPRGSVPVMNGFVTKGLTIQLEPFGTRALDYGFYFPAAGDFPHYPAHVARDGALVAAAPARTLHVVAKPSVVDTTSWQHVAHNGSEDAVLAYLDAHNLLRVDLAQIAWRLRDKTFFTALLGKLRLRMHYSDLVWAHGILHGDESATHEYLRNRADFQDQCGRALASKLLTIDPIERGKHQHLEFDPLFHARAHRLGKERMILNQELATQYAAFCEILCYLPKLDDAELARVTYYLLLQDRIEEALAIFPRIDPAKLASRLQYDYMRCYLGFFTDDLKFARQIAEQYRDHPVERWRTLFRAVVNQLDEAEGKASPTSDESDRMQRQTQLAASEPALELAAAGNRLALRWQNLTRVQVQYYRLDVEAAFSSSPFVTNADRSFAYVQPNRIDTLDLPPGQKELTFDLPSEFQRSNVLVEARGAGISRRVTCLSSSLAVQTIESYGQLQVTQAQGGKPVSKVYVKVYARMPDDRVRFHKDGYTDLRGRFDYASVSERGTEDATRFAILVLSESEGAVVREANPPGR